MDIDRQRVQDDLRGIVHGDVFCDPIMTQLYASDASIYQIRPLGVIRPRSIADVVATAQYAAEHELSIHPRGAASGVAGESLGSGLVIDFSRYMRRISVSVDDGRVSVQSGATLAEVNRSLRERGTMVRTRSGDAKYHDHGERVGNECFGQPLLAQRFGTGHDRIDANRNH